MELGMKLKTYAAAIALALTAVGGIGLPTVPAAYAAPRANQIQNVENEPMPAGVTAAQAETAVLQALSSRGWTVQKPSGGSVDATYARRDFSATITVKYSKSAYSITYKDSSGLKYDAAKGTIHPNYNRWIANLKLDITRLATNAANGVPG
jgi:hypothetical protein